MGYGITVNCPGSYYGIKQVTYTFSTPNLWNNPGSPNVTSYDINNGVYSLISSATGTVNGSYTVRQNLASFGCPKDSGTYTITIDAQCWLPPAYGKTTPTSFDDVIDTLTMKVEAPTVSWFQVADQSGPNVSAAPFWFGATSPDQNGNPVPNLNGTSLTFMMAAGARPTSRAWDGYWANVTNNTHYDLIMGFIQIVNYNISETYTNGTVKSASGTNNLDVSSSAQSYFYHNYTIKFNQGTTSVMPINSTLPQDSPLDAAYYSSGLSGYLQQLQFHAQFNTSLVVAGGWLAGSSETVGGYPIALSTAQWHLDGLATNTVNQANPAGANYNTTTDPPNWSVQMAAGAGPSPATLPGANAPWIANGDGKTSYLSWSGNTGTTLAPLNGSVLSSPAEGRESDGSAMERSLVDVPLGDWEPSPATLMSMPAIFLDAPEPTLMGRKNDRKPFLN